MRHRADVPSPATEARSFEEVAATLRSELLAHPDLRGGGSAGHDTLETNSGFVERRGQPLVEILCGRAGAQSLAGLRLLDLGCGFGALSAFFAFRGAEVIGIDPNVSRLAIGRAVAERHGLAVELRRGRMEEVELPDAGVDLAVMNNSLCYLVDPADRARALAEALRVLAPGGVLAMRNPNRLHPVDRFTGIPLIQLLPPPAAVAFAARLGRKRSLCRLSSPAAARRELLAAGFCAPVHHAPPGRVAPVRKLVSQYTHLSAARPGG